MKPIPDNGFHDPPLRIASDAVANTKIDRPVRRDRDVNRRHHEMVAVDVGIEVFQRLRFPVVLHTGCYATAALPLDAARCAQFGQRRRIGAVNTYRPRGIRDDVETTGARFDDRNELNGLAVLVEHASTESILRGQADVERNSCELEQMKLRSDVSSAKMCAVRTNDRRSFEKDASLEPACPPVRDFDRRVEWMINRGRFANNACTGHRVRVQVDERIAGCGKFRWKDFYFEQILR